MDSNEVIITETTVGFIDNANVLCGNIYKRINEGASGIRKNEISVDISINAGKLETYFLHNVLNINGQDWEIIELKEGKGNKNGKVKLRKRQ